MADKLPLYRPLRWPVLKKWYKNHQIRYLKKANDFYRKNMKQPFDEGFAFPANEDLKNGIYDNSKLEDYINNIPDKFDDYENAVKYIKEKTGEKLPKNIYNGKGIKQRGMNLWERFFDDISFYDLFKPSANDLIQTLFWAASLGSILSGGSYIIYNQQDKINELKDNKSEQERRYSDISNRNKELEERIKRYEQPKKSVEQPKPTDSKDQDNYKPSDKTKRSPNPSRKSEEKNKKAFTNQNRLNNCGTYKNCMDKNYRTAPKGKDRESNINGGNEEIKKKTGKEIYKIRKQRKM